MKLLFIPDPEKEVICKYSFHDSHIKYAKNIVKIEGFITEGKGGLDLKAMGIMLQKYGLMITINGFSWILYMDVIS